MYFISHIRMLKPANKMQEEMCDFIGRFEHLLIGDELSYDALKLSIRCKIDELHAQYPRVTKLVMTVYDNRHISVGPEMKVDTYVFIMQVDKVKGMYVFSENNAALSEKGGGDGN